MPLSDVKHQERAGRQVTRALAGDRVPHAYIFHGPDGVGKELFARRLAALLLCAEPMAVDGPEGAQRDACGRCQSCRLADADNHPDLHIVHRLLNAYHPDQAVRNRKAVNIGVEVIRHFLIDAAGIAPAMGRVKVFIVREADRISDAAQNALLKTLEEPPAGTFIMLLASSLDQLLPTTRSRCQLVPFGSLPTAFVLEGLTAHFTELSPEDAALYAALSQGSMAAALRYAADELAVFHRELAGKLAELSQNNATVLVKAIVEFAKEASGRHRKRDAELSDTAAQRAALRDVFVSLSTWYREHLSQGGDASAISPAVAAQAVRLIAATEQQLDLNVNVQLCIESLVFQLARLPQLPAGALT